MAIDITRTRAGDLFHIDFTITGTTCDTEQTIDLANASAPAWKVPGTIRILDFSVDKHAGTLTTMSPVLSSVSGSTKARDTIQPAAGTAIRPDLGVGGVLTWLGAADTKLYLKLTPDTSHATNDVRGRITFCAARAP